MPAVNLKGMGVDELLSLRSQIDSQLTQKQRELQDALSKLERLSGAQARVAGKVSRLKGSKVAPKFRGPDGETWAGRGARPRWLTALLKQGHKLDEFLIGGSTARKGAAKRGRKRKAA